MRGIKNKNVVKKDLINQNLLDKKLKEYTGQVQDNSTIFLKWHNDKRKEEEVKFEFLHFIFKDVLKYETDTLQEIFNLRKEKKTDYDKTKPDGSLGFFKNINGEIIENDIRVIIEIKGKNTKNLDEVEQQAFEYRDKIDGIEFVIISNTEEIRLYSAKSGGRLKYQSWTMEELSESFEKQREFYFLLAKERLFTKEILKSPIYNILNEEKERGEKIEKEFYNHYSTLRENIWGNLIDLNNDKHYGKNFYLYKAQKLIDRIIFIRFCRENKALDSDAVLEALNNKFIPKKYSRLKFLFQAMNDGNPEIGIAKFNGGLFAEDKDLDCLNISDEIIDKIYNLYSHDFGSDLDVNILGHIFEQSISDLENLTGSNEKKRKKDGVFYTPSYITEYIIKEAVGNWLEDRKKEINAERDTCEWWEEYAEKLKSIKILDPACGSGAFLVKVFDYLQNEWKEIENHIKTQWSYKDILINNIYGVDINSTSVGITKLSLWLKTAHYREPLTTLDNNIKVGNSLIDDPRYAGYYSEFEGEIIQEYLKTEGVLFDSQKVEEIKKEGVKKLLAFKWEEEFKEVFKEKELQPFHFVFATYNSRYSDKLNDIKNIKQNKEYFYFDLEQEVAMTEVFVKIVKENQNLFRVLAYNICKDHVHMLVVCGENDLSKIAQILKGKSSRLFNQYYSQTGTQIWGQKYISTYIVGDRQLENTIEYIQNNRYKHELEENKGLKPLVEDMCVDINNGFQPIVAGGFDVVVGNPPYVDIKTLPEYITKYIFTHYISAENRINLYSTFIEKGYTLLKNSGYISMIIPNSLLLNSSYVKLREIIFDGLVGIVKLPDNVFQAVKVESMIFCCIKNILKNNISAIIYEAEEKINNIDNIKEIIFNKKDWLNKKFNIFLNNNDLALKIEKNCTLLYKIADFSLGITPYDKYQGHTKDIIENRKFHSPLKINENYKPIISGESIKRFFINNKPIEYINYGEHLGAMRDKKFFTFPRIIVRQIISARIQASYTEEHLYFTQIGFSIIAKENSNISNHYLTVLLNSKLLTYYHGVKFTDTKKKLFSKILIENAKQLPIKIITPQEQTPFIQKAEKMIDLNKGLQSLVNSFLKLIEVDLKIEKITKKLKSWYKLENDEFFSEIAKQNKAISLNQKSQWIEHFENEKLKANKLSSEIDKTDKEIDQMVYQLYGLTKEEIEIIESNN